jgi:hypothetical protein
MLGNCNTLMTRYGQTQTSTNGLVFMGHSNQATECHHIQNCMHIPHVFESFDAMKQEISDSQKSLLNSTTSTYFTLSDLKHRY